MKIKIILATRNQGKIREIQPMLDNNTFEINNLSQFPAIPEVIEDGITFQENALKKATAVFEATGIISLADDSGLEVDYLKGEPGVYSSRFAGENATDAENNRKLLRLLDGIPPEKRTARFHCVMILKTAQQAYTFEGTCKGIILQEPRGNHGFGYDPLFYVPEYQQTFAELDSHIKNQISHRGMALRKVIAQLKNWEKNP
jgi:XTP/dITP diphosphohydrolase